MLFLLWFIGLFVSVYFSIHVIKGNRNLGFSFLSVLLAGYILISNMLTPRLISITIGFTELTVVTGSIIWPFTAQLSDMINEVYGKKKTVIAVIFGYIVNFLFVLFVLMANETMPIWDEEMETFWKSYFLPSGRVFLASSVSYFICQFIDINVFSYFKEKNRVKEDNSRLGGLIGYSSLRSVLSDIVNMICDAVIFSTIAFVFVLSKESMIDLIISSIIFKGFMSIIDTPLFALFRVNIRNIQRQK